MVSVMVVWQRFRHSDYCCPCLQESARDPSFVKRVIWGLDSNKGHYHSGSKGSVRSWLEIRYKKNFLEDLLAFCFGHLILGSPCAANSYTLGRKTQSIIK